MKSYNVHEVKTHLSRLLKLVLRGEEIIIAKAGVPVARLVPASPAVRQRRLGTERGRIIIAGDFDAPLPPRIIQPFDQGAG